MKRFVQIVSVTTIIVTAFFWPQYAGISQVISPLETIKKIGASINENDRLADAIAARIKEDRKVEEARQKKIIDRLEKKINKVSTVTRYKKIFLHKEIDTVYIGVPEREIIDLTDYSPITPCPPKDTVYIPRPGFFKKLFKFKK